MTPLSFQLKHDDFTKFAEYLSGFEYSVENVINRYLHGVAVHKTKSEIIGLLPKSDRKLSGKHKSHLRASEGDPFKIKDLNLGFKINTKNTYNYLLFPNDAVGTSIKNRPQEFMEDGLEQSYEKVLLGIYDALEEI